VNRCLLDSEDPLACSGVFVNYRLGPEVVEMFAKKWIAVVATVVSLLGANMGTTAFASTSHWSRAKCVSWVSSWHKRHPHATKSEKRARNRVLRAHGCPRSDIKKSKPNKHK
jgi:hypothetical protein